eukprot:TRINITY_DN2016_c0_g2_i1.p1 TRINITY_DN2016_c0_g2~~TRINITY_DN2016_c0_g2_i1.p1  ORF type:complete len:215 (+),score=44.41 TRINITY_DN2016_c0_g2_i1:48-647(+)
MSSDSVVRRKRGMSLISDLTPMINEFARHEIEGWFDLFNQHCDELGLIDHEGFVGVMAELGVTDAFIVERNFIAWDLDKDGRVSQEEFILGVSILLKGNADDRIDMAYKVYDVDQDGLISKDEMYGLLKRVLGMKYTNLNDGDFQVMVLDLFSTVGIEPDEALDLENFRHAIKSNKMISNCFADYAPPPPPKKQTRVFY